MNNVVLRRRLIYIGAIVLLLLPLYNLGHPPKRADDGTVEGGGVLAQLRSKYDLGQGDLGEIDPASESMRLATLGLRGVASTILWQKAEYYKKEQYWDRLSATLNQIAVLQPHFVNVWEFQSHNLSYNVSAEFDDYRQRYQWVKKGMNYLVQGAKYNKTRTEMPFELGWFFGSKLGVADEKEQFRAMYRDDDNFHDEILTNSGLDLRDREGLGTDNKPDNWLSGRLWYERSYEMVKNGNKPAKSTMMFYLKSPQWLMKYAEAIQREGVLDTPARQAWARAGEGWKVFGERPILTTFGDTIYLRELKRANDKYEELLAEFQDYCGDAYQSMLDERMTQLTPEQISAWTKLDIDRTFDEVLIAEDVGRILDIQPAAVAKAVGSEKRVEALYLADNLKAAKDKISHIEIYRNQINFAYWDARCIAEQEDEAVLARTNMYDASNLLEAGELDAALQKYEIAFANWSGLFNKHPAMMIDDAADAVLASIGDYEQLLDEELPSDFELRDFMTFREVYDSALADPAMMSVIASWPTRFPNRNFLTEMLRKSGAISKMKEMQLPSIEMEFPDAAAPPSPVAPAPAGSDSESEAESEAEADAGDSAEEEADNSVPANDGEANESVAEAADESGLTLEPAEPAPGPSPTID